MRLTKTAADAARYPHDPDAKRLHVLWDDDVPGFGLRVYPSGRRAFVFTYRHAGRKRWLTIGDFGPLTVRQARARATKARAQVLDGIDPAEAARKRKERARTMADLADEYMTAAAPTLKPSTRDSYRGYIRHVTAAFGRRRPDSITEQDVRRWYAGMADEPHGANRRLWMLSKLMDEAEHRGFCPGPNPCRRIKRFKETKRERFLSAAELARMGDALRELEDAGKVSEHAAAALRLLLFTGCRVSEVLKLRWADLDLERGIINLPDAKAGARAVHLNAPALAVLDSLPRTAGHPYVIEGQVSGERMKTLQRPWNRVREAAGIPDVRLHDLRHSVGAWSASGGDSLLIVGALLGHRRAASTERYAHLSADPVRQASERVGAAIAAALQGEAGDVVELRAARRPR